MRPRLRCRKGADANPHGPSGEVHAIERRILAKNDALASRIRAWLAGREILAVNLVSSPGPGKTALLERTIPSLIGSPAVCGKRATSLWRLITRQLLPAMPLFANGSTSRVANVAQWNKSRGCSLIFPRDRFKQPFEFSSCTRSV